MNNISDKLKEIFQNFRWIDNIPEDQFRRDEICMQAKAALLLEANCTSERFPAFIRNAQKFGVEKCYKLPQDVVHSCKEFDDSGKEITIFSPSILLRQKKAITIVNIGELEVAKIRTAEKYLYFFQF